MTDKQREIVYIWIGLFLVLLLAMVVGCHGTYYKQVVFSSGSEYIYWREYKPVSNLPGVCAEVYSLHGSSRWGAELHKVGAPEASMLFDTKAQAEAWGDSECKNEVQP